MRTLRAVVLVAAAAGVAACGTRADITGPELIESPSEPIHLAVEQATYAPGAEARVQLKNASRQTFGYNLCSSRSFEQLSGDRWIALPPELRICTQELRTLHPGAKQESTTDVPLDAASGTYRLAVTFFVMAPNTTADTKVVIRSAPFTIAR